MMIVVFEFIIILLFLVVLAHGLHTCQAKRLLLSFSLVAIIVTLEENLAMISGDYTYMGYHLWIWRFPLAMVLAWIAVAYLGFQVYVKYKKMSLSVLTVSCLDLLMEPLAFYFGLWCWNHTIYSPITYFGAPIQNAVGWLILVFLNTWILKRLLHHECIV